MGWRFTEKMKFQINDIIEATGGKLLKSLNISGKFTISTDTRSIKPEEIFMPIVGANFDGHEFIQQAIDKGCRGYFVDKDHKNINMQSAKFIIQVDNTLEAYLKLANFYRKKIAPIVIAVTGSSGKTTVKEMIFSAISSQYKTHKSKLNHNNEMGLCQTLIAMPDNTEVLVVEMGMRGLGEIELLSKYAEPDIAVITNAGTAHLGRLGTIENIAKAKCEIAKYLHKEGTLIAFEQEIIKNNANWSGKTIFYSLNSPYLQVIEKNENYSVFVYKNNEYKINVAGEFNILNAVAAIEVALLTGVTPENIKKGLIEYKPIDNRGQIFTIKNNIKVINDSYNANPESMKASIKSVLDSYPNSKITLVLGDMGELGDYEEKMHREVGSFISDKPFHCLITVGKKAEFIAQEVKNTSVISKAFNNIDEAVEYLLKNVENNSVIFLKASRAMAFDKISEQLKDRGV